MSIERADQLRAIARKRKEPLQATIARFINAEIRAGTVSDQIPGFVIKPVAGRLVSFSFNDFHFTLSKAGALKLAEGLKVAADDWIQINFKTKSGTVVTRKQYGPSFGISVGSEKSPEGLIAYRRGQGVVLARTSWLPGYKQTKRPMAADVARDLARMLRSAARKKAGR